MSLDNEIKKHDEIDLSKLIIKILNNKLKISLFAFASIFVIFIYHFSLPPTKISYKVQSEIRPISIFEEADYVLYNSYINQKTNGRMSTDFFTHNFPAYMEINKKILLELFLEEIIHEIETEDSKKKLFQEAIEKFEIVKKEDYTNDSELKSAVVKLASSIQLNTYVYNQNVVKAIDFRVNNINQLTNFVKFIEKNINQRIQKRLEMSFENQILTQKKLREFEIKDTEIDLKVAKKNYELDVKLKANLNDQEKGLNEEEEDAAYKHDIKLLNLLNNIESKLSFLIRGNDLKRFENIILASPITKPEKFIAAKLVITKINEKGTNDGPPLVTKLIMAGLFGLILGIFYMLISSAIIRKNS
jgi:hypothetical protein